MQKFFKVLFVVLVTQLPACRTVPPNVDFRRVKIGDTKPEVVEIIGSPRREERKYGRDWWYYQFEIDDKVRNRMIVFEKGKVIYAGRVTTPAFVRDVESIDKENEISNQGLELSPPKDEN